MLLLTQPADQAPVPTLSTTHLVFFVTSAGLRVFMFANVINFQHTLVYCGVATNKRLHPLNILPYTLNTLADHTVNVAVTTAFCNNE
jgi:hypothetical protein